MKLISGFALLTF